MESTREASTVTILSFVPEAAGYSLDLLPSGTRTEQLMVRKL